MRIVQFPLNLDLKEMGVSLKGGVPYVCCDSIARFLHRFTNGLGVVSSAVLYSRPYSGQSLNGKRLVVYRPLGWGDSFITAGVIKALLARWPSAHIDFSVTRKQRATLWDPCPFPLPFGMQSELIPLQEWDTYDYHLCGEHWCEEDAHPGQGNIYDSIFYHIGLPDPTPADKVPWVPEVNPAIRAKVREEFFSGTWPHTLVWQLTAATPIRTYPPEKARELLHLLWKRLPNYRFLMICPPDQWEAFHFDALPGVVRCFDGMPALIEMIRNSRLVLGPDSAAIHIAGALGIPSFSYWSSFHPDDRIKYYPGASHWFQKIKCSPCRAHERYDERDGKVTITGCPLTACGDYCAGLRSIDPEVIADQVVGIIADLNAEEGGEKRT